MSERTILYTIATTLFVAVCGLMYIQIVETDMPKAPTYTIDLRGNWSMYSHSELTDESDELGKRFDESPIEDEYDRLMSILKTSEIKPRNVIGSDIHIISPIVVEFVDDEILDMAEALGMNPQHGWIVGIDDDKFIIDNSDNQIVFAWKIVDSSTVDKYIWIKN